MTTAAYIHIPFCRRRCYYCDFPVSVVGDGGGTIDRARLMRQYVQVLCEEIRLTAAWFPSSNLSTVFFGGGTPSLLPVAELDKILTTLDHQFSIAKDAEISIEIDPATFDLEQLKAYQRLGVNRYSLGVQSFDDNLLSQMGRTHREIDIYRSIEQFQQVGIHNFSLDLISGLPNQTLSQWENTLEKAIDLSPTHLSCYDLIVESGTAFQRQADKGTLPLPPDETSAQMYRLTQQHLTRADYIHYEISNYARVGYHCRHNRIYWQNLSYYGFGMGAASFLGGKRFTRSRTRREYSQWVETLSQENNDLMSISELDEQDQLLDTLMLRLRLQEGIDLSAIAQQYGSETAKHITSVLTPYIDQNWVNLGKLDDHDSWGTLKLSDPEGFLFSNQILAELFSAFLD